MAGIELSEAERELLRKVLAQADKQLFHEIHKTDDRDFKATLKRERDQIEALLGKLGPAAAP